MSQTRIAKLFRNGASQAVRLPAEFRFAQDEVYATRDELTGDVLLSQRPGAPAWADFFEMVKGAKGPTAFMSERPMNKRPKDRRLFGDKR